MLDYRLIASARDRMCVVVMQFCIVRQYLEHEDGIWMDEGVCDNFKGQLNSSSAGQRGLKSEADWKEGREKGRRKFSKSTSRALTSRPDSYRDRSDVQSALRVQVLTQHMMAIARHNATTTLRRATYAKDVHERGDRMASCRGLRQCVVPCMRVLHATACVCMCLHMCARGYLCTASTYGPTYSVLRRKSVNLASTQANVAPGGGVRVELARLTHEAPGRKCFW